MHAVNDWIRREADADRNLTFVDTRSAVAAQGEPDRLASSPDELHPSADGYRRMAETLLPALDAVISDLTGRISPA
jgi:lysophospholipase L1-like esterase